MFAICVLLGLAASATAYAPAHLHHGVLDQAQPSGSLLQRHSDSGMRHAANVTDATRGTAVKAFFQEFSGGVDMPIMPNPCTALACLSLAFGGHIGGTVDTNGLATFGGGVYVQVKLKLALVIDLYISMDGSLDVESQCDVPAGKSFGTGDVIMPTLRNFARDLFSTNKAIKAVKKLDKAHKAAWKAAGYENCRASFIAKGHEAFPLATEAGAFLELDKDIAAAGDFQAFHDSLGEREQLMMYEEGISEDLQTRETLFYEAVREAYKARALSSDTEARRRQLANMWFDKFLYPGVATNAKNMMAAYYGDKVGKNIKLDGNLKCDATFRSAGTAVDKLVCRYVKTLFLEFGEDVTKALIGDLMDAGFPKTYPRLFSDDVAVVKEAIRLGERSDKFQLLAMCPQNFQDALAQYEENLAKDKKGSCAVKTVTLTGQFSVGGSLGFGKIGASISASLVGKKIWTRAPSGANKGKMEGSPESGWALELDGGGNVFGWSVGAKIHYSFKPSFAYGGATYSACVPCQPTNTMTSNANDVSSLGGEELRKLFDVMQDNALMCGGQTAPTSSKDDKDKCITAHSKNAVALFKWIYASDKANDNDSQDFWTQMGLQNCTKKPGKTNADQMGIEAVTQLSELALAIKNTVVEGFVGTTALPTLSLDSQLCVEATIGATVAASSLLASKTNKVGFEGGNFGPSATDPTGAFANLGPSFTGAGDSIISFEFTAGSSMSFSTGS